MCDFSLTARHQLCVLVPSAGLGDSCSVAGCAAWHSGLQTRLVRRELIPAALRGSARGGGRRGDRQLLLGALSKLWQWGDHSTASRDLSSSPAPARGGAGRSRPSPQASAPPAPRGTRGNDHGRDWSASKRHRERLTRRAHSRPRGPCRSAPLLHLLSALFPDRGPGHLRVGQSPAGPWDTGAALHRKSVCAETCAWPGFTFTHIPFLTRPHGVETTRPGCCGPDAFSPESEGPDAQATGGSGSRGTPPVPREELGRSAAAEWENQA